MLAGVLALVLVSTAGTSAVVYGGYRSVGPKPTVSQPVKKAPTLYYRPNPRRP